QGDGPTVRLLDVRTAQRQAGGLRCGRLPADRVRHQHHLLAVRRRPRRMAPDRAWRRCRACPPGAAGMKRIAFALALAACTSSTESDEAHRQFIDKASRALHPSAPPLTPDQIDAMMDLSDEEVV